MVDTLELDLHLSADDVVIVWHDPVIAADKCAVDGEPMSDSISGDVAYCGSILPAAWSLMLSLRARSIGATWTTLLSARQQEVAQVLKMPAGTIQTVMLPVGYTKGAVLKRADRQAAAEVTFWNRWGELED